MGRRCTAPTLVVNSDMILSVLPEMGGLHAAHIILMNPNSNGQQRTTDGLQGIRDWWEPYHMGNVSQSRFVQTNLNEGISDAAHLLSAWPQANSCRPPHLLPIFDNAK